MTDLLIVVDMQRDFVSGALGSEQARAIVPAVAARIRQAKAEQTQVAFTLDTHEPDYLNTREGRFLPVPHCIRDTPGWALEPDIAKECAQGMISFAKPTFGSAALCEYVRALAEEKGTADGKGFCVELCGVCTDICVISNALLLKAGNHAFLPDRGALTRQTNPFARQAARRGFYAICSRVRLDAARRFFGFYGAVFSLAVPFAALPRPRRGFCGSSTIALALSGAMR